MMEAKTEDFNKKREKYVTSSQKNELIQSVSDNYIILFDRKTSDVVKRNIWTNISMKLNAMGPNKTVDGWKRCFTTLKAATKAKYVTGQSLNDTDAKIAIICNMQNLDVTHERSKKEKSRKCATSTNEGSSSKQVNVAPPTKASETVNAEEATFQQIESGQTVTHPVEESGTNANLRQRRRLVKVVGEHYGSLFGKISSVLGAHTMKDKIWSLLTVQLNILGTKKDVKGWQNCFSYLKSRTKEKLTLIRQYEMRNGCRPTHIELSDIEKEIIEMCNIEILDGNGKVVELGVNRPCIGIRPNSTESPNMLPAETNPNVSNGTVAEADETTNEESFMCVTTFNNNESARSTGSFRDYIEPPVDGALSSNQTPAHARETEPILSEKQAPPSETQLLPTEELLEEANRNEVFFQNHCSGEISQEEVCASNSPSDSILEDTSHHQHNEDTCMEIRQPQEPPPKRRGIEVNNCRYVRHHRRRLNDDDVNIQCHDGPRRNRLSVPLAVMAEESLELQRSQNAMLTKMISLLRGFLNQ